MKHYDLTGTKVIEAIETPWVYCNDNMTVEEKVMSVQDWEEWISDVLSILRGNDNVIYLEDYLQKGKIR